MSKPHDDMAAWDKIAIWILSSPSFVGIIAAFGYVGHLMISGQPLTKRRLVGGVMLALFVGYLGYALGSALGIPDKLCVPAAMLCGSVCEAGYVALTQRALDIMGKRE